MDFLRKIAAALNENRREWFVPALLLILVFGAIVLLTKGSSIIPVEYRLF